ncbi:MAG: cupin domain-containing protein [Chitinophagaceae bacterium]
MNNEIGTTETFSPVDYIEYAAGSVVSKTIIKKPSGNITLFAFDKGEGLAEHSSPHEAMVQITDGQAEIIIGENGVSVQAGKCIVLPANIPHSLRADVRFKMLLTMIKN